MVTLILLLLILLWLTGSLPSFTIPAFNLGTKSITFNEILVFLIIIWLIGILPGPFRQIAILLFLFWLLSSLGIFAIAGLSNIVLLVIIFGIIAYMTSAA